MFNFIQYIKNLFGSKVSNDYYENDPYELDCDDITKNVLEKRFEREARAYDRLSKKYENFYDLPQSERYSLMRPEFDKIIEEDKLEDLRVKSLLRTIETLRTEKEIENAVNNGHKVLKQSVVPSEDIRITDLHIKDKQTGEIEIKPYNYHNLPRDYDRYEIDKEVTYYPYNFPSKVAAYLLPNDLKVGERVVLEDLIEDIVGASHAWGTYRLDSTEAIWNGEKFEVDCRSYDVNITMG